MKFFPPKKPASEHNLAADIYTEVFPLTAGDTVDIILLKQLTVGETLSDAFQHDARTLGSSISDEYEYVMYGICYASESAPPAGGVKSAYQTEQERVKMTISFGGLLMQLTAPETALEDLHIDDRVYALMRKQKK